MKRALQAWGYRYGPTTRGQLVALDTQAPLPSPREQRRPTPEQRPHPATAPPQVWCADLRDLVTIAGHGLSRSRIFAGDSRAIVGAGGCDRQQFAPLVQVFRPAMAPWRAPETGVSDPGAVLVARQPGLAPLAIQGAPITPGHAGPNLADGGCSVQRRLRDAAVADGTDRETGSRPPPQFVQDDQCWGPWAHTRQDAQGRLYDVSPDVILAHTRGRLIEAGRLRRIVRLRQRTRQVRQHGQLRLHNFGLSVDRRLWGQTVAVLIDDAGLRLEPADHLRVSDPCVDDTTQRRITAGAEPGRPPSHSFPVIQRRLWALEILHAVWLMAPSRRSQRPRRGLRARQLSLCDGFAP